MVLSQGMLIISPAQNIYLFLELYPHFPIDAQGNLSFPLVDLATATKLLERNGTEWLAIDLLSILLPVCGRLFPDGPFCCGLCVSSWETNIAHCKTRLWLWQGLLASLRQMKMKGEQTLSQSWQNFQVILHLLQIFLL